MTNYLEGLNFTVLASEAKDWIEDTFERVLFNVVWENDEPVAIIVTVHKDEKFFLSKGQNLVDIQQELENWNNNGIITNSADE